MFMFSNPPLTAISRETSFRYGFIHCNNIKVDSNKLVQIYYIRINFSLSTVVRINL